MNNKGIVLVLVVLVLILGGWWMFGRGTGAPVASAAPLKIGFIGPLTGDVSALGNNAKAATEIAVEEINAAGGVNGKPVEAVYEDGKCNATASVTAANKLIGVDKVNVIVGGACSTETAAFAPTAMQAKVITMSYCSSAPNLTNTGKYFFRDYPSDAYQGKFAAEYIYNTLGKRNVAILYHVTDWGTGLKDVFTARFTELGGKVVAAEGQPQDSRDYRTALTKIKGLSPDMVYVPLYTEGATVAINQAKELGIKAPMFGADTFDDPKFQTSVSKSDTFMYTVGKTDSNADFVAKLSKKVGSEQQAICAAQAYDATKIIAQAVGQAGIDPDKLSDVIRATKYDGVSGHIEFDNNGDMTVAAYTIKKVEKGVSSEVK